jgi:hypothetical protein
MLRFVAVPYYIYRDCMFSIPGYVITAETLPGQIRPGDNTVMTEWADVKDQINKSVNWR